MTPTLIITCICSGIFFGIGLILCTIMLKKINSKLDENERCCEFNGWEIERADRVRQRWQAVAAFLRQGKKQNVLKRRGYQLLPAMRAKTDGGQIMTIELHQLNTHGMMEQAGNVLDGVVRLKARIAELEEERRWRKCSEEIPEDGSEVLATDGEGVWLCYKTTMPDGLPWFQPDGLPHIEGVTHWKPLPSAPKEDK